MTFISVYLYGLAAIMIMMTIIWLVSVIIRNASIVDIFWGSGFIVAASVYFLLTDGNPMRKILLMSLVSLWGLRLSLFIGWRNYGRGEDFRYQQFRKNYGADRYWWVSYFQVFLLQGFLMWLVSAPLLAAQFYGAGKPVGAIDIAAAVVWLTGFIFEAGGDFQLAVFRADPANKGRLLTTGFWKYTRHPNYFGDSAVWWGFGLFALAAGNIPSIAGSLLMTFLIIKISGVAMLEKSLKVQKPGYEDYVRRTSAFIPWFPKK